MSNDQNTLQRTELPTAVNSTDTFVSSLGGLQGPEQLRTHCFCSVEFTDANGSAVTPGAGTYTVSVKTVNNPNTAEAIPSGTTVDATAAQVNLSVASPILSWVVTTAGITTATHYVLRYSTHRN